jgi:hypothetical protein
LGANFRKGMIYLLIPSITHFTKVESDPDFLMCTVLKTYKHIANHFLTIVFPVALSANEKGGPFFLELELSEGSGQ